MAYEKTIWKNREVERPRTYTMQNNTDGTITLIPAEGEIIEAGTPIIAENMNKIEQGIEDAHNAIDSHLEDNTAHGVNTKVPMTRTVNGKALSSNITLSAEDVGALSKNPSIVSVSSSKTLTLTDAAKVLNCTNSSAITITIPANSSVAFPVGTEIAVIRSGAGTVTFSPASGVTLNSKEGKRSIDGQYASCALKKIETNVWVLVGALTS